MTPRSPRCAVPMRRNERDVPVLEDPVCGRRAGHSGQHLSEAAVRNRRFARRAPSGSPDIAAAILQARQRAGMSQRSLASAVGVTQASVVHWERARLTPGPVSWVQLQLALGPLGVVRDAGPEAAKADHASAA